VVELALEKGLKEKEKGAILGAWARTHYGLFK
jgi:hypothetical protein